jgi:hypothetical protein
LTAYKPGRSSGKDHLISGADEESGLLPLSTLKQARKREHFLDCITPNMESFPARKCAVTIQIVALPC